MKKFKFCRFFSRETAPTKFNLEDAIKISKSLNIDFSKEKFDLQQFTMGINVELEHSTKYANTNVTENDPILTGKIALAHLQEFLTITLD